MDALAGGCVTVDGVGAYVVATVPRETVARVRSTFKVRGGGQMIALFAAQPSIWFRVGQVQASLRLQGVCVSVVSVRAGLNQLVEMGFLQKMIDSEKVSTAPHRYRRLLTEAQRDLLSQPVRVSAPLATAIKAKRERRKARRAEDAVTDEVTDAVIDAEFNRYAISCDVDSAGR